MEDNLPETEFKKLEDALVFYTNRIAKENSNKTNIQLYLKQIAIECGLSEKGCRQMFKTLLTKELQKWPKDTVNQIVQRIQQFSQQFPELSVEEKKRKIRSVLDEEFQLRQQVQSIYIYIYIINYLLKKYLNQ
ncbi:Hypothetical_protein [Hexamita inflata]|uniref:Hypothetical_protein n=1 Tax=Hexamita inflata TaxID=28002 RepID=A0AA86QN30_9EUKA|nr:Hypothetical protein HINF_LOCUS50389 [Hexamita inflata]